MNNLDDLFGYRSSKVPRQVGAFLIEPDLPIEADKQEIKRREHARPEFPFAEMDVGDSFRVNPFEGLSLIETQNRVSGAACTFRKKHPGRNFTTRQIGRSYVRCWRTA